MRKPFFEDIDNFYLVTSKPTAFYNSNNTHLNQANDQQPESNIAQDLTVMTSFDCGGSVHWHTNDIALQIAKKQISGSDARSLISPDPLDSPTVKSPPKKSRKQPKNHQMSYRQALKEMQRKNQENVSQQRYKIEQEKQRRNMIKNRHFGQVQSKVFSCDAGSSSVSTISSSGCSSPSSTSAVVEMDENNCSTKKPRWSISQESFRQNGRKSAVVTCNDLGKHKSFGRVPTYIREQRARMAEEERIRQERIKQEEEDRPPVEGMIRMKESERLETLQRLKEDEQRTRTELQRLPLAVQSHGTAKKRELLEIRLREIEEAKATFSRNKVFIKNT